VATQQTPKRECNAPQQTILAYRLGRVLRASRLEPAGVGGDLRDGPLVDAYQTHRG